jgi:hypothetical protein
MAAVSYEHLEGRELFEANSVLRAENEAICSQLRGNLDLQSALLDSYKHLASEWQERILSCRAKYSLRDPLLDDDGYEVLAP